jgi:hypothetical protein
MDRVRARNWYLWLWLSPLLTLPTLAIVAGFDPGYEWICGGHWASCNFGLRYGVTGLLAALLPALWHLTLLIPARDKEAPLVRWHGRQALVLAGVRTAIACALGLSYGAIRHDGIFSRSLLAVPLLIVVWFAGTIWGQRQAARGDCSLMRWAGHGEELSALQRAEQEAEPGEPHQNRLEEIIRYSRDPEERRKALSELERLEMVEPL